LDFFLKCLIELFFFLSIIDVFLIGLLFELFKISILVGQLPELVFNYIRMVHACLEFLLLLFAEFLKNFKVALNCVEHIDFLLEHLSLGHNHLLEFFEQPLIVIAQFECCILQINRLWLEDLALLVVRLRQCVKLRSR